MKVTKILTDLLKAVEKNKTLKIKYSYDGDYVCYTPDGNRMFRIYKDDFLIDITKALPETAPIMLRGIFDDSHSEDAFKTNEIRVIDKKKTIIKIAGLSASNYAWINTDYLKEFDDNCTFRINGEKNPVFIYEQDELVGLIMPVIFNDQED